MRRILMMLIAAVLFVPAAASAQTTTDVEAEARIQAAIATALQAGVPQSLLETKVAEGRAKGVAAARIAAAVEHRAEVLARVMTALEAGVPPRSGTSVAAGASARRNDGADVLTEAELTAAADAHEAGVSLDNLVRVSARAGEQRAAALVVLADLVAAGRVPEHAFLNVQAALGRGGNALAELHGSVGGGARPGVVPPVNGRVNGGASVRVGGGN